MRINQKQLDQHLNNTANTKAFYWLNSEDSFLLQTNLKKIRQHANTRGFNEKLIFHIDSSCDWSTIENSIQTPSLFNPQQIIELHFVNKISKEQQQQLIKISEDVTKNNNNFCIIIYPFRMDSKMLKQKWLDKIDENGAIVTIWPLSHTEYPSWLKYECSKYKINFTPPEDFNYFCQKTMGNPSIAMQTLYKLKLQHSTTPKTDDNSDNKKNSSNIINISKSDLLSILDEHANYNIFDLVESFLLGNIKQAFAILKVLKLENTAPLLIIWTLRKELLMLADIFEQASSENKQPLNIIQSYKLWQNKKNTLSSALKRLDLDLIYKAIYYITKIENTIKTENNSLFIWQQIESLLLLSNKTILFDEHVSNE